MPCLLIFSANNIIFPSNMEKFWDTVCRILEEYLLLFLKGTLYMAIVPSQVFNGRWTINEDLHHNSIFLNKNFETHIYGKYCLRFISAEVLISYKKRSRKD